MGVRHGKDAFVTGIPCISSWQVSEASNAQRYVASCGGDGSLVPEGNVDLTGSIAGVGWVPPIPDGVDLSFRGVASNVIGSLLSYTGTILIQESTLTIPVEAGGPPTWSANFGVQGELTKDAATGGADTTRSNAASGKWGKVLIGSGDTEVSGVRDITLTLRRPPATFINAGATSRRTGNLECDIAFNVYNDDKDVALYALNAIDEVKIVTNEAEDEFWWLSFIRFLQKSNFVVDRGQLIGYQVTGQWSFVSGTTEGFITLPDGTDIIGDSTP